MQRNVNASLEHPIANYCGASLSVWLMRKKRCCIFGEICSLYRSPRPVPILGRPSKDHSSCRPDHLPQRNGGPPIALTHKLPNHISCPPPHPSSTHPNPPSPNPPSNLHPTATTPNPPLHHLVSLVPSLTLEDQRSPRISFLSPQPFQRRQRPRRILVG